MPLPVRDQCPSFDIPNLDVVVLHGSGNELTAGGHTSGQGREILRTDTRPLEGFRRTTFDELELPRQVLGIGRQVESLRWIVTRML